MDIFVINGKECPFLFCWGAYKELLKLTIEQGEDSSAGIEFHDKGIYQGFVWGAKKEKQKVIKYDELLEFFDLNDDDHDKITELYLKQYGVQKKRMDKMLLLNT